MKRRNLILITALFLVMLAGCEAAPESKEIPVAEQKQPVVIAAAEETISPAADQAEQKDAVPIPEMKEPAEPSPEEEDPSVEKKTAQVSEDPVEIPKEQQDPPKQEPKPTEATDN